MASPVQTPYAFSENATVIIPRQKEKQINSPAGNLADTSGAGQMARWNVELCGDGIGNLQHAKNGKDLRIEQHGDAMDVKGVGGKFTKSKVHQQNDGTVRGVTIGNMGKWTKSSLYPRGAVAEKEFKGAGSLDFDISGMEEGELTDFLNGKIIPDPEQPAYKMKVDEYLQKYAKTGDVILCSGSDLTSKAIRWFSNGGYHHVALVFKGNLQDDKGIDIETGMEGKVRVLQAVLPKVDVDYKDPVKRKQKTGTESGVVITDFYDFYKYERKTTRCSVRRLAGSDEKLKEISNLILKLATKVVGRKYVLHEDPIGPNNLEDFLLLLQSKLPKSEWTERSSHDTYVCSTLNAHVLINAGVLNKKKHPDGDDIHWWPKDFSPKHLPTVIPGDEAKGDFTAGVTFGEEIELYPRMDPDVNLMAKL